LGVLLSLKKLGRTEGTIRTVGKRLRYLSKHCSLDDPEQVKKHIAEKDCGSNFKRNLVDAYEHYVKAQGLTWSKPFYQREERLTRVPTRENINKIISHARLKAAAFFSIIRDAGLRPIEVARLKVKDVDLENGVVHPTTAKGGSGRAMKLPASTVALIKNYIAKRFLGLEDRIFATEKNQEPWKISKRARDGWIHIRDAVAEKLQEPELKLIRLYDLRHFYATMLYHKTKDILLVKRMLGHKNIEHTMIYTHLVNFAEDEWICKAAETVEEAQELIEAGFRFEVEMDGVKLFRKRK